MTSCQEKQGLFRRFASKLWPAVTNIGYRPTFEDNTNSARVETHVLDFTDDIYGQVIQLDFIDYLRAEIRFDSVDALVEQIDSDISQARHYFS